MNSTYVIGLILLAAIVLPIALLNHKKGKKNAAVSDRSSAAAAVCFAYRRYLVGGLSLCHQLLP